MASRARADLESLLRARKLDRALTTALPPGDCSTVAPSGIPALDARLGGGVPRGHLSELVGPRSSGRMRRLPFTTWFRLQRIVEGSQTASVLVGSEPMARSSAGLTLRLGIRDPRFGIRFSGRLFDGLDIEARIVRARVLWQEQGSACDGAPRIESACGPREQPGSPTRQPRWGGASESAPAARVGVGSHANEMTSGAARAVENVRVPLSTTCA